MPGNEELDKMGCGELIAHDLGIVGAILLIAIAIAACLGIAGGGTAFGVAHKALPEQFGQLTTGELQSLIDYGQSFLRVFSEGGFLGLV